MREKTKEWSELKKLPGGRLGPFVCGRSRSPARRLFRGVLIPRALEGALPCPCLRSSPQHTTLPSPNCTGGNQCQEATQQANDRAGTRTLDQRSSHHSSASGDPNQVLNLVNKGTNHER